MVTDTTPKPTRVEGDRQIFGEVTEDNDRIYSIERKLFTTAADAHLPFILRMWGKGHWCVCNGVRGDRATEEACHAAGQRWIAEGAGMNAEKITAELDSWIYGEVIARRTVDKFGTQVAVTQGPGGFTLFRAFALGEDAAGVSVDLRDVTLAALVGHLLPDEVDNV